MKPQILPNETYLDLSLTLRPAQWSDLSAVTQLIYDVCEDDGDTTVAVTEEELKSGWKSEGFTLEKDAFVVQTQDGRIVGYEEFFNRHGHYDLDADGYVHPKFKGLGVGTSLLRRIEERAREEIPLAPPGLRVFLRAATDNKDETGKAMFAHEGYAPIRYHWRMEINLTEEPAAPTFPAGVELRPFVLQEHARALWEAENEAFRDHWGSHESKFDEWYRRKFDRSQFDPTLYMIAWDDGQIAGFSQNRFRMGIGWVGTLGVRRLWRKRGLGFALLTHSFREFYKRGMKTIGLGVDASNPTGATRLYQRAGMYPASEFVTFEKELRPGRIVEA